MVVKYIFMYSTLQIQNLKYRYVVKTNTVLSYIKHKIVQFTIYMIFAIVSIGT